MRSILLIAIREYRQIASTRGFWVMLLVLPAVIAITQVAGRFMRPQLNSAYVLVDASNQYAPAIEHRIEINRQRFELSDLSAYVQRWEAGSSKPDAVWAKGERYFTDEQIEQFMAEGGAPAALELIKPKLPKDAPVYEVDPPVFVRADLPADVEANQGAARLAEGLAPYLKDVIETGDGERPLALAVYIPPDVGPAAPIRMWTNGTPNTSLIDSVRTEVVRIERMKMLEAGGMSPELAAQLVDTNVPLQVSAPPQGEGRELVAIRSVLPLALAYLLMVTTMVTGSMMLQSVIEEKSNKLLESVLACVKPSELMYGKLLRTWRDRAHHSCSLGWGGGVCRAIRAGAGGGHREAISCSVRPAVDDRSDGVLLPCRLPDHLDAVSGDRGALELVAGCAVLSHAGDLPDHPARRADDGAGRATTKRHAARRDVVDPALYAVRHAGADDGGGIIDGGAGDGRDACSVRGRRDVPAGQSLPGELAAHRTAAKARRIHRHDVR